MSPLDVAVVVAVLSLQEILLILLIVVLLFGAAKIPQIARSLGRAKSEFEAGKTEGARALTEEERLREEARTLGIATEGKSVETLKLEIAAKRG